MVSALLYSLAFIFGALATLAFGWPFGWLRSRRERDRAEALRWIVVRERESHELTGRERDEARWTANLVAKKLEEARGVAEELWGGTWAPGTTVLPWRERPDRDDIFPYPEAEPADFDDHEPVEPWAPGGAGGVR